ncbi:MAG: GntR family transcriptional regulator [Pseudomonadota bacterium]
MCEDGARSVTTKIQGQLRRDIVSCILRPNERLTVSALSERYGISATPVREALNRLAAEGLVRSNYQRGFAVAAVSHADMVSLTKARVLLERVMLSEAISLGDNAWEERIVVSFHRLSKATQAQAVAKTDAARQYTENWDRLHWDFHAALFMACGSHHLIEQAGSLFEASLRYMHLACGLGDTTLPKRDVDAEHRAIMESVLARDVDKAVALASAHIKSTQDFALKLLPFSENKDHPPN